MPYQRNIRELLDSYRECLLSKVSKVRILGEADERDLKDVFVELSIVDQRAPQQHASLLSMMDSTLRRRFDPFGDTDRHTTTEPRRRVKPDELLRPNIKAIITGAPGCGKTTLLKYLALQAQLREKRLVIWLELKAIDKALFAEAERAAAQRGNLILLELWLKHIKAQLSSCDAEIELLREDCYLRLKRHEIVVLLDGFDEVQDEATEQSLNKCVREFVSAWHENTLLISTRPYAQHKLGNEHLQELEIEPLNQSQVEAFLNCYYPNDSATKRLLNDLRYRSSVSELLYVPLLLGVILRLYRENRFEDERLKLYETIISDLVRELDRSKSVIRQFRIKDDRLRLDFLKFLAFDRLLGDRSDEKEQERNQIIFSYDLLKEKAREMLAQERSLHNARDLVNDALTTPLLREVSTDTFAFTHLTLQEYLAARAFTSLYKRTESVGLSIFCRAFHNSAIVEMEVLPMILGSLPNSEELYNETENLPESLTFTNFRLRVRGFAYVTRVCSSKFETLAKCLTEIITGAKREMLPFFQAIVQAFSTVSNSHKSKIYQHVIELLQAKDINVYRKAIDVLSIIPSEQATLSLIGELDSPFPYRRKKIVTVLQGIDSDRAIHLLSKALDDENLKVRESALSALSKIGTDDAIAALSVALRHSDRVVRERAKDLLRENPRPPIDNVALLSTRTGATGCASVSLEQIESITLKLDSKSAYSRLDAVEMAMRLGVKEVEARIIAALKDPVSTVRGGAASALGVFCSKGAVSALLRTLNDRSHSVKQRSIVALGQIGAEEAVEPLINIFRREKNPYLRVKAFCALAKINPTISLRYAQSLLAVKEIGVRKETVDAIGELPDSSEKVRLLQMALIDTDPSVRIKAVSRLKKMQPIEGCLEGLLLALLDENIGVSGLAAPAFNKMGDVYLENELTKLLHNNNSVLRKKVSQVVGYYSNVPTVLYELLNTAETDPDNNVRECAKEGASKFTRKLNLLGYAITKGTLQPLQDNESRELFLIGESFKVVAEAGHIFRPTPNSDWGIDGEIEFKNERGEATGQRVYLQLKSGDSYLRKRGRDGKEIFTIKKRHAEYWRSHAYPVLLVIRDTAGQIRWMNVTEYLQRHGSNLKQIEFLGEPFTAQSVKVMPTRFAR